MAETGRRSAAVSRDGAAVKSADLEAFAVRSLPSIEVVFDDFYRRYESYRTDLAIWQAQYGAMMTPPAQGPVTVNTVVSTNGSGVAN